MFVASDIFKFHESPLKIVNFLRRIRFLSLVVLSWLFYSFPWDFESIPLEPYVTHGHMSYAFFAIFVYPIFKMLVTVSIL